MEFQKKLYAASVGKRKTNMDYQPRNRTTFPALLLRQSESARNVGF